MAEQEPNCDGIRKTKTAIVRNTYNELETTTLATFKQWFPEEICKYKAKPMHALVRHRLPDGTSIEGEVVFLSIDRPDDVKKLLSFEVSFIFLNEARELPWAVVKAARERIGRYPSAVDGYDDVYESGKLVYKAPRQLDKEGNVVINDDGTEKLKPCTRKAVLMDTNPPDDDHWWYQLAEEGKLRSKGTEDDDSESVSEIFDFFRGPSPFIIEDGKYINNPEAENIKFLDGGYQYYRDMLAGNTADHINVMVMGNYGTLRDGKPVYPAYNDKLHCPEKPIGIITSLPIGLAWDGGLTPCCVIGQLTPRGQLRIIAELMGEDMSVRELAMNVVKPYLQMNFWDVQIAFSVIDPSGNNRGEGEGKTAMSILNDEYCIDNQYGDVIQPINLGFTTRKAKTNDLTRRIDAVNSFMLKLVDGQPGYLLSKNCKMLRKGKIGGYQYKKIQMSGESRYKETPDKNMYSHPADAEQYLALEFAGGDVLESNYTESQVNLRSDVGPMGY